MVKRTIADKPLVGFEDEPLGTVGQRLETRRGEVVLVHRAEHLGGGTIVLPLGELEDRAEEVVAPYGKLSILEAPQYSSDVPLESYLRFWKRLGAGNIGQTKSEFLSADSGPVAGPPSSNTGAQIAELVKDRLQQAAGVSPHLIEITVRNGTVLLEGDQEDTTARLAAGEAAATVPGVREIVNMLVVRAA